MGRSFLLGRARSRAETAALRESVVAEWNKCDETMAQIAERMGLTRGAVARHLTEARAAGMYVVACTPRETAIRAQASLRSRIGEEAFRATLAHMRDGRRKGSSAGASPDT